MNFTLPQRLYRYALMCGLAVTRWRRLREPELWIELQRQIHETGIAALPVICTLAAITGAASGLFFMSESDHVFTWISSASKATAPANAAFVHRTFNATTNGDAMADKPLSSLKSETVPFESFAARFVPQPGEDADLLAYHTKVTRLMGALRTNLKNPVVLRFGRKNSSGLVGAISVYVIGTLPSGKIGGVFTVSVET